MVVSRSADVYNHADVMRLTGADRSPSGPVRVTVHYRNQPTTSSTPSYVPGGSLLSSSASARRATGRYVRSSSSGEVSSLVNRLGSDGPRGEAVRPPRRVRFDLPPPLDGERPVNGQDCVVGGGVVVHSHPAPGASLASLASLGSSSTASPHQEEVVFGVAVPSLHSTARYCHGTLTSSNTNANTAPSTLSSTLTATAARTSGAVALVTAAREGDDDVLGEILRRAAITGLPSTVVNYQDSGGRTAASHLAGGGNLEMFELLLQIPGVDVNLADKEANTPLHFAAQAGHVECVHFLLSSRPDVQIDARNALGFTPLMKAALQGRTKCARVLLHAGASPTMRDCGRGLRADQWARYCGRYVCAEAIEKVARTRLLQRSSNGGGLSSLAAAGWGSQPDIATLLSRVHGQANNTQPTSTTEPAGFKSRLRKAFRGPEVNGNRSFSLVTQLTGAGLCASTPALPAPAAVPPVVKSLLRPLTVPRLQVTPASVEQVAGAPPVPQRHPVSRDPSPPPPIPAPRQRK